LLAYVIFLPFPFFSSAVSAVSAFHPLRSFLKSLRISRAALWPGTPVTPPVLRTALYAEAERSLLYVGAHLAARRPRRGLEILRLTGRHVSWWRVLPRFALNLPRLLRGQLARLRALRSRRMVVYGRGTRMGPPLPDPQA